MIEVEGLSCSFDGFMAISELAFTVEPGEIFGFIGPNGAGKTTTIRILATLQLPSAGRASIGGYDVLDEPEKVREILGYMPDAWGIYNDVTVFEYLEFFASAYGIPRGRRATAIGGVMELTDLTELKDKLAHTLSKGMRQRLCLAKTLIHDPELLILDEPADGLDPRARIELRELLKELASMGKTIFISSHILTELSDLVTSVGIVERGSLLMSGDVQSIVARLGTPDDDAEALRRFVLRTTVAARDEVVEALIARPDLSDVAAVGEREARFAYRGTEEQVADVVRALAAGGSPILGLAEDRKDLEDVFMAVTKGEVQ
jgi:ABC-2 type transport system ATP-binding protein